MQEEYTGSSIPCTQFPFMLICHITIVNLTMSSLGLLIIINLTYHIKENLFAICNFSIQFIKYLVSSL